jgi:hypothetical protein
MKKKNLIGTVLGLCLAVSISGCAAMESQAEIEADFIKIAKASCDKAQKEDVIQRFTNDKPARIIALSRDHAYKNYSAVYIDNKGMTKVVYELELTVCGPSYLLSMQEEANHDNSGDYEHHIKRNDDGSYTWSQHVYGEDGGTMAETKFTVLNGFLVSSSGEDAQFDQTFEYGPIGGSDLQALKTAVDAELERLHE